MPSLFEIYASTPQWGKKEKNTVARACRTSETGRAGHKNASTVENGVAVGKDRCQEGGTNI